MKITKIILKKDLKKEFGRNPTDREIIFYNCAGIAKEEYDMTLEDDEVIDDELNRSLVLPIREEYKKIEFPDFVFKKENYDPSTFRFDLNFIQIKNRQISELYQYHEIKNVEIPVIVRELLKI
jgi:hypothetical protein